MHIFPCQKILVSSQDLHLRVSEPDFLYEIVEYDIVTDRAGSENFSIRSGWTGEMIRLDSMTD